VRAPRFLLDTNIVSDLVRNPRGTVAQRVAEVGSEGIAISVITTAELRFGCVKKGSWRLTSPVDAVLEGIDIIPLKMKLTDGFTRN
jgi:tRNA(fMet)-specific endonuclease VapC